jgi:arylsulfatase A-like enzyme
MRILSHFGYGKAKGVGQLPESYEQYVNPSKIKQIQQSLNQIPQSQPQISNPTPTSKKPPIVILLTIDSLKADLFEGRLLGELKSFENLKKQSLFFSRLYTSSTATRFSLGSMFFGKYPSHLIWKRDSATHPSLEREKGISLAESLKNHRIKSLAITTAKDLMRDQHGIGRGFSQNRLLPPSKKQRVALSHQVIDQMLNVLKKHPKTEPLFIYSHIMDAHHPFDAGLTIGTPYQRYLSELKLVGQQIDRLLAFIKTQADQDRYYLMITADHGQGFGRHRVKYHNGPPYEHQIKVPFWFYHPLENTQNQQVLNTQNQQALNQKPLDYSKTPFSLIDLYPTILSIFGITQNPSEQQGFNLWPYLDAIQQSQSSAQSQSSVQSQSSAIQMKAILQKRMLLSVNWHTRALIIPNENLKIIEDTQLGQVMMFDLKKDPNEQVNLCETEQGKIENLSSADLSKCDQMANLLRLMIEFQGQQPSEF